MVLILGVVVGAGLEPARTYSNFTEPALIESTRIK